MQRTWKGTLEGLSGEQFVGRWGEEGGVRGEGGKGACAGREAFIRVAFWRGRET